MIEKIYSDCERLTILEMRMYLRAEISRFCVQEYKNMPIESKIFLYKLNSFLYFCNEFSNKADVLKAMRQMITTQFKDRYHVSKGNN